MKAYKNIFLSVMLFAMMTGMAAAEVLMPFVLASKTSGGDVQQIAGEVKGKLTGAGFEVVGEYSPYNGASVIVVTNDELKTNAGKSEPGGFGAAQRVGITKNGDDVEVIFTNPVYMAAAYRMEGDLAGVRSALDSALGSMQDFGSEKDLTAKDLRKYHYTVMMEYFDDPSELAEYDSYEAGVAAVEAGLAAGKGGAAKVYRIDVPGKKETLFGVALKGTNAEDCSGDEYIMSRIDKATPRSTAHLPYEILVTDDEAIALYARFRIAINWPHLPMMKSDTGATFMSIMCAPAAIEEALEEVAGG